MANEEQLAILKQGVDVWNRWREEYHDVKIDLRCVDLPEMDLRNGNFIGIDISNANFEKGNLGKASLRGAYLFNANFKEANLSGTNLSKATLSRADLTDANLSKSDIYEADFNKACLKRSDLSISDMTKTELFMADLSGALLYRTVLHLASLDGADLSQAILDATDLSGASLEDVILKDAKLLGVNLASANLRNANFYGADLTNSSLIGADLRGANLNNANLTNVNLQSANLSQTQLKNTNFSNASIGSTFLIDTNLSTLLGLETVFHYSSSEIGESTIQKSKGKIPNEFLRGCGFSDADIEYAQLADPELSNEKISELLQKIFDLKATRPIQISPIFISYSHKDSAFVDYLQDELNNLGIRFWRDVHNATAGRLETQIDRAIRHNPTVLLILSEHSTASDWVEHEARLARKLEKELGRDVLCPIALDDSWKTCNWPERIKEQIMEYNILDFSNWEDDDELDAMFKRLIDGLDMFYKK